MNRRLWISVTAVFTVFTAVVIIVGLSSEHTYKKTILTSLLEGYADIVSRTDDYSRTLSMLPADIRVSVVKPDGRVIFDSYETADAMDNHLSRPEIRASLVGKDGCSIRKSETSGIKYIYFARNYDDVIVRTALPFAIAQKRFMHPDWMLALLIVMLFSIAVFAIRQLSIRADARAEREADSLLQSQKKRITGNLAHELRTPVTSIRGYLETLVDNPDLASDKRLLFTERAYLQTLRLSDLIRDISLITKMEEAPQMLNKEYLNIRKLSEDVFDEFASAIEEKNDVVENMIQQDVNIKGNHTLLYALLRNLIENSVRYGGDGITIRLESFQSEDFVRFVYSDTGKGVSEEHLGRIFERFYRIPEESSHRADGSGLGLSIVKNAVAFHGGSISARLLEPRGLCFDFTLSRK